ncbi:type ISP restriction/modification enzyme [Lactobacillus sp. Sy-1]|uniref:type ISP restriction/modification enzyme n=1 Tax=Lactobacillus sp. Sy-1 TaxID=2109645 RepID=UPI001C5B7382|nr:type ISP restriction/modification enzyme [Lactobacillus sp. Sy-1]MBW1606068.1 DEAD/DEAH box helicase [Lactobacillus sp. Sy-1]
MATFDELINQIDNSNINNQRDRGTAFEHMVVSYLKNEPIYKQKFKHVWPLNEVPEKYGIPKKDTGVDIVACDMNDNLTAVQAKFYKGKVGKDTINSFIAEAGKEYYADGIIASTTDDWNANALNALKGNSKPFTIIGLSQLRRANFEWQKFSFTSDNDLSSHKDKQLRSYQKEAIEKAVQYFNHSNYEHHDRGKLIMAPGTGKTFTSLKITEALMKDQAKHTFNVLYLVPSIQLLSQTLFNWNDDIDDRIHMTSLSVVSDQKATKKAVDGNDELNSTDMGFPATTDVDELMRDYKQLKLTDDENRLTINVVFSTYQSIDVIHQAQESGYPEFDLIIADEAHRTTGAKKLGEDSMFTKVHSNTNVKGKLRLYQTATPKIYDESAKKKAVENSIVVSSMDDEVIYGKEFFRLGFGAAVAGGWLTDYKVSVLAVSESYINKDMQKIMSSDNGLKVDDIGKIIGVWNAMVKRNGITGEITGAPMKRVIGFTDTIKHSQTLSNEFNRVVNDYLGAKSRESFNVDVHHVDGGLNALRKNEEIDWLASDNSNENQARMLSNVRFLTEGIDVPNLDGIVFFNPKKSQVDIVQAVGRIMRLAPNKEYGYIIIPVVIPEGVDPSEALDNNERYRAVWQVLNALRSTDESFEAEVNKLDLNKKKSGRVDTNIVGNSPKDPIDESTWKSDVNKPQQIELPLDWQEMQNAFYGKVVQKVGNRRYLEDWSKDVANIAKRHIQRIKDLIDSNSGAKEAFNKFVKSLRYNINESISGQQAIEMLAQHLITEPIFNALFGEYSFVNNNVVSKTMNDVLSAFKVFGFNKEQEDLKPFYDSITLRASGIDNAEGKQKLILTLYDKFFSKGFKETTEQLGIVFTPVEVVDFIVNSVDHALQKYFGKRLVDKNVNILDPFTGTGTFMTRTLTHFKKQLDNKEITYDDILRKYMHEMYANEIVLLSYYIAAINIEATFEDINPDKDYKPFDGIVLTDTFASTENKNALDDELFGENNERLKREQEQPITAIISNPPYSIGQRSANDDNENVHYPYLDNQIKRTYVEHSSSTVVKSNYDSYIKAFRWASDRIGYNGVIGFITNGSFLSSGSLDGFRYSIFNDFNHLYVFNLRGNQRTIGEQSRKEGGKIFGSGSRAPIAISILVKDGSDNHEIYYHDIGDYLSKSEKLKIINDKVDISHVDWKNINPDNYNDWLDKRDVNYTKYLPLFGKNNHVFNVKTSGITTNRDSWLINFNKEYTEHIGNKLIKNYDYELKNSVNYEKATKDDSKIKWSATLKNRYLSNQYISDNHKVIPIMYRPFTKRNLYYNSNVIDRPRAFEKIWGKNNISLLISGKGSHKSFDVFVTDCISDYHVVISGTQVFPFYDEWEDKQYNLSDAFIKQLNMTHKDALAYIYGLLNSNSYQNKYSSDLVKDTPRIPIAKNKEKYVEIGKNLMGLHLNYEKVSPYSDVKVIGSDDSDYTVKKMRFAKYRNPETKKLINDKSTIIFNDDITVSNIPEKAYDYVVNGRSAIEWIMDQYQVKTDKKTQITDNPNEYSDDPKYIFNLLLSIINVSVKTVDLINQLPKFEVDEEANK